MLFIKPFLIVLLLSTSKTIFLNTIATTTTLPPSILNSNNNVFNTKITKKNSSIHQNDQNLIISSQDITSSDAIADEIKNEVFVNDLLETVNESSVVLIPETHQVPHYEIDWNFIDKDTIRVKFDLYSLPKSLMDNNIRTESKTSKINLIATMTTMPSSSLKSLYSLEYFLFIIRPYNKNREIVLKMAKLNSRNTTSRPYPHFENSLRLTSLNHKEKYSICIYYYQKNISMKFPDLLLCQDIINDYAKFAHLKADAKHGLVFIGTQYSIIIGLLVVLQSVYSMRKRRITEYISQHLTTTAHSIRSTLSSVSLVRQSFSSLDAAAEQQHNHHTTNTQNSQHETKTDEEGKLKRRLPSAQFNIQNSQHEIKTDEEGKTKKRSPSTQFNTINHLSPPMSDGATSSDETEPFLKRVSSKNHVHFLLGPGEGSDDDDDVHQNDGNETNKNSNSQSASDSAEPYGDQADALLSMAHILDTNKPWSRHNQDTSSV
ncbi:unnamed protein product [Rotaria magnacalcarata]|nr:unnamed protein product [Rotaria magnacalcarata]CAF1610152.1 unnamed protein product [Rotaria magnacalcarata]CAF2092172.1 unnamed protein product [Rotaria magnacalcarata]CAF2151406.1 unnamed protein product [Rotaria magnacalcarata]CAF3745678.1 unnamed protein product [Rotaria magnacalcarata]